MKAEPILTRVNEILALSDDPTPIRHELEKLAADLAGYVRQEAASSRGVGNAAKTIQRMLNAQKKHDGRRALHYAWTDAKGRQCVTDGFRAYRLNEPLPLEPRPDDAGTGIDLDKVMPDVSRDHDALPLPSLADLKAHIALERAANSRKHEPQWDFGPGRPLVSAVYLLDLMTVLPDAAEIFVYRGARGLLSPLYVRSERGDAVLLPCRPSNQDERGAQAEKIQRERDAAAWLRCYVSNAQKNPDYSMEPDDFAKLAAVAYQPAA